MTSLAPIFLWRICCLFWFSITEKFLFTKSDEAKFFSAERCATTRSDTPRSFDAIWYTNQFQWNENSWLCPNGGHINIVAWADKPQIFKVLRFWDEGFSWGFSPLKNPHQILQNCSAFARIECANIMTLADPTSGHGYSRNYDLVLRPSKVPMN